MSSQALLEALYEVFSGGFSGGFYVRSCCVLPDVEGFKSALRTYIHLMPCWPAEMPIVWSKRPTIQVIWFWCEEVNLNSHCLRAPLIPYFPTRKRWRCWRLVGLTLCEVMQLSLDWSGCEEAMGVLVYRTYWCWNSRHRLPFDIELNSCKYMIYIDTIANWLWW